MVMRLYTPPVIREHVEDAQDEDKEACRPLRLESNSHHDTSDEAYERYHKSCKAPLTLEHETDE